AKIVAEDRVVARPTLDVAMAAARDRNHLPRSVSERNGSARLDLDDTGRTDRGGIDLHVLVVDIDQQGTGSALADGMRVEGDDDAAGRAAGVEHLDRMQGGELIRAD